MDDCRFDNWTRMLGGLRDRRTAFKEVAGAGIALISLARADLGLAEEDDVLTEGCRLTGERCKRNNNCCSNKCKKGKKRGKNNKGEKECRCLKNGRKCKKDAACCKGHCDRNTRKCTCTPANDTCSSHSQCCGKRKCVRPKGGGNKVCKKKRRKNRR